MKLGLACPDRAVFIARADVEQETVDHIGRLECPGCDLQIEPNVLLCNFHDGFNQGVEAAKRP